MSHRFRRLRKNIATRNLVRETFLTAHDLVQPYFVIPGKNKREAINAMPGIFRLSVDLLIKELESFVKLGGNAVLLFGVVDKKDLTGKYAYDSTGPVVSAIKAIKKNYPGLVVITDVCLCAYMTHGHCGVVCDHHIDNDKTLPILTKMAIAHANAGADILAPSDMMDFRVKAIRDGLSKQGFEETGILSYAVKYASSYYGPFREAAHSAPEFADRKTYQMDPANKREALKEAKQDVIEGADMLMVKPALAYLDIISLIRNNVEVPVVAYNVSGEYSMVKAASQRGWIDEKAVVLETLLSMKRAGADIIVSYHANDVLKFLK